MDLFPDQELVSNVVDVDLSPSAEWMRRNRSSDFFRLTADPSEVTDVNPPDESTSSRV